MNMQSNLGFIEKLRWRLKIYEHGYQQNRHITSETALIETEYGKVEGVKRLTIYDVPYYSFEGIPYAQPPVGELRFRAPQRPTPWEGVRDCKNTKEMAVQTHAITGTLEGSEDCLYLNVYTNNIQPDKPRPVMIWIHGGGFSIGEATRDWYGPDYLMEKDVVLVTIQYRLGVLGFLSLNTPELNVPGNAGLKDQVLAIKWVKNNCSSFGGNPDCITVFGESAGAASAHCMMLTEQTQGIFQRVILMSGNALPLWETKNQTARAFTLAKLAGYKGEDNEKEVLQFLRKCKAKDLIALENRILTAGDRARNINAPFLYCVEPYLTPECVIPKPIREMMKTAWGNAIPLLVGHTSDEGLIAMQGAKQLATLAQRQKTYSLEPFVPFEVAVSEEREKFEQKLKATHVSGKIPTIEEYKKIIEYSYLHLPLYRLIRSRFTYAAGAPLYLYRFDFDSEELPHPFRIFRMGRGVKGVSHADELSYLFSNLYSHRVPKESREYRTIERMLGFWTQFALSGNPNDEQIPGMTTLTWEPLKKSEPKILCLNINDDLKLIEWPELAKAKVWASAYDHHKELLY
ncbi:esterase B1-like [Rhagoletis pomonella]|uniref:esterase B1-like n=1 Tax=Rhagoletis pomonella TaxID=28610 RepID=UPI0017830C2B|nr:esterase B1-like [Rhagoletis pomonella]XP_036329421.1 esterase B1-like [Rhagoletis pomonella]